MNIEKVLMKETSFLRKKINLVWVRKAMRGKVWCWVVEWLLMDQATIIRRTAEVRASVVRWATEVRRTAQVWWWISSGESSVWFVGSIRITWSVGVRWWVNLQEHYCANKKKVFIIFLFNFPYRDRWVSAVEWAAVHAWAVKSSATIAQSRSTIKSGRVPQPSSQPPSIGSIA